MMTSLDEYAYRNNLRQLKTYAEMRANNTPALVMWKADRMITAINLQSDWSNLEKKTWVDATCRARDDLLRQLLGNGDMEGRA